MKAWTKRSSPPYQHHSRLHPHSTSRSLSRPHVQPHGVLVVWGPEGPPVPVSVPISPQDQRTRRCPAIKTIQKTTIRPPCQPSPQPPFSRSSALSALILAPNTCIHPCTGAIGGVLRHDHPSPTPRTGGLHSSLLPAARPATTPDLMDRGPETPEARARKADNPTMPR